MMKMDYTGRTVIITGAGKGIGKEVAVRFAETGANIALVGHRSESILRTKAEIEKYNKNVMAVQADVSDWDAVEKMAETVNHAFGSIDILVNNAGITLDLIDGRDPTVIEVSEADYDRVINTNLKGQFHCAKAVLPYMMKQMYGRIINISSTVGLRAHLGNIAYSASKAGVIAQTKMTARQFGRYNICVNCVAPGLVLTPIHANDPEEVLAQQAKNIALGRPGYPKDVAHAVLFFASEELFATGQTLIVDGGNTMM